MRPLVSVRLAIRKQVDPTVDVIGLRCPGNCKRIKNFLQPAQIDCARKFYRARGAPSLGEPFDLGPAMVPFQLGKDRLRFDEKLRKRRL